MAFLKARREFLKTLAAGAGIMASGGVFQGCSSKKMKPNIVLINIDDLGWTDLSCYGSEYYETPNIDKLCSQGMKFENGYAACAVCSPTRASLLTGRYPARIGVTDWIHHLDEEAKTAVEKGVNPTEYIGDSDKKVLCPPNPYFMELSEVTIAELLKEVGYSTCHIGKWHLGPDKWLPQAQGFDINIGGGDMGQPPTYFDPYYQNERRPDITNLPPRKEGEYLTDRESDEAVKFINDNAARPFFLNMCHYAVHTPIEAKEEIIEKYERKEKTHHKNASYAAMIESVDQAVGKLLETLEANSLTEKTFIIFTSDNGGLLHDRVTDNRPLRSGKGYPYEGGIRVPLIFKFPGKIKEGKVCQVPACSIDIFPTIAAVAGVSIPEELIVDGLDLSAVLQGEKETLDRDSLFWHFPHYRLGKEIVPYSIIRQGKWKLIKRYEGKEYELFDLAVDPGEKKDTSTEMPEQVEHLSTELEQWLKDTGAKVPRPNPDYQKIGSIATPS